MNRPAIGYDPRQHGLTLLELLVVLLILAALGTVTLTQTTSLTDEARYEQTVRTLEQLQDAVIGRQPYANEDPTAVPPGFVADIGRLPLAGNNLNLSELWDRSAAAVDPDDPDTYLPEFALQTLTGLDDDLEMASGWRGPYMRRPIGSSELNDGWGQPFGLEDEFEAAVDALGDPIARIGSAGSGQGDAFDPDPARPFEVVFWREEEAGPPVVDNENYWQGIVPTSMSVEFALPLPTTNLKNPNFAAGTDHDGNPLTPDKPDTWNDNATDADLSIDPEGAPGKGLGLLVEETGSGPHQVYQNFDTVDGRAYHVSLYFKRDTTNHPTGRFLIHPVDSSTGNINGPSIYDSGPLSDTVWPDVDEPPPYAHLFVATQDKYRITLQSNGDGTGGNIQSRFDEVWITGPRFAVVRLYGIEDGLPVRIQESELFEYPTPTGISWEQDWTTKTVHVDLWDPSVPNPDNEMAIGPKVLRAYQLDPTDLPMPATDLTDRVKSALPARFTLSAGGPYALPSLNLVGQ